MEQQLAQMGAGGFCSFLCFKVGSYSVSKGYDRAFAIDRLRPEVRLALDAVGFRLFGVSSSSALEYALSSDGTANVERCATFARDDFE
ncbi:MAG: hypothetical protein ABF443_00055 [Acetobacter malorum]|uniref:hypothetical protein n=1 Tax=Acetobacter malorum TaxID=178901 RepID=UPI0039E971E3